MIPFEFIIFMNQDNPLEPWCAKRLTASALRSLFSVLRICPSLELLCLRVFRWLPLIFNFLSICTRLQMDLAVFSLIHLVLFSQSRYYMEAEENGVHANQTHFSYGFHTHPLYCWSLIKKKYERRIIYGGRKVLTLFYWLTISHNKIRPYCALYKGYKFSNFLLLQKL